MKVIVFTGKQVQVLIKLSNNKEYDLINYKFHECILHASIPMKQTKVRFGTPTYASVTYNRCPSMLIARPPPTDSWFPPSGVDSRHSHPSLGVPGQFQPSTPNSGNPSQGHQLPSSVCPHPALVLPQLSCVTLHLCSRPTRPSSKPSSIPPELLLDCEKHFML
jgi:hypothetical protein